MKKQTFRTEIGGHQLIVEINDLAEQANGSCLVRYGDTTVLATAVMSKQEKEEVDFFPLTVNYEERYYAAGKILGSRYLRRESRPSEEAILTSRLIDRAIRPRFPEHLRREVQIVVTCLSWDGENDPDIPGLISASIALSISDIPWSGPISALRIAKIDKQFILNPYYEQRKKSELEIVLAGIEKNNDFLVNMIEAGAKEVTNKDILDTLKFADAHFQKLINFQRQIIKEVGKKKTAIEPRPQDSEVEQETKKFLANKLEKILYQSDKEEQGQEIDKLKEGLVYFIEGKYPQMGKTKYALSFLEKEIERLIHENIIKNEQRPDGRKLDEIRKIYCEAGLLPRTHGSGLFCRGKTKALSILTLGSPEDQKLLEGMEIIGKKRFMHHYNFPPYCSGEVRPMRGPGRREIGHGMLAEKALSTIIPNLEEFPYTIRIVTEILSSNGSTSMASVSSSSLALMDAGVPIKSPVAGIAIGLIKDDFGNYKILTDIQGPEDHYGDMDLKIAGTRKGITAIQMDVKIDGINKEILRESLERGKRARLRILEKIEEVLPKPRPSLSQWAPRIYILQIKPEKIGEVIGPKGKMIHEIIEKCGVAIDIEDSGKIYITADKEDSANKAIAWIKNITKEVKIGEIFQGKVKKITDFGAFVEILPGQEGLVHISQLAPQRVRRVEDIVQIGELIPVKVISIDDQGRISLSLKEAIKSSKGRK